MLASVTSMVVAGLLDSTALHDFHATLLGIHFGPVDTIYTAMGLLTLLAGIYAMLTLRGVRVQPSSEEQPLPEPDLAEGHL